MQDDSHNQAIDAQDTSHNNGDQGSENKLGSEHTNRADTDTGLGSAVGSTQVAEHKGRSDSHEPEEGVLVGIVISDDYERVRKLK